MCAQGQEITGCYPGELRSKGQMGDLGNKEGQEMVDDRGSGSVLQRFECQSQHGWWGALNAVGWWTKDLVDL